MLRIKNRKKAVLLQNKFYCQTDFFTDVNWHQRRFTIRTLSNSPFQCTKIENYRKGIYYTVLQMSIFMAKNRQIDKIIRTLAQKFRQFHFVVEKVKKKLVYEFQSKFNFLDKKSTFRTVCFMNGFPVKKCTFFVFTN